MNFQHSAKRQIRHTLAEYNPLKTFRYTLNGFAHDRCRAPFAKQRHHQTPRPMPFVKTATDP
ncbi:MAG: hypothetical protein V3V97_11270, partial [Hyphomicrobiaceae bacterium]